MARSLTTMNEERFTCKNNSFLSSTFLLELALTSLHTPKPRMVKSQADRGMTCGPLADAAQL